MFDDDGAPGVWDVVVLAVEVVVVKDLTVVGDDDEMLAMGSNDLIITAGDEVVLAGLDIDMMDSVEVGGVGNGGAGAVAEDGLEVLANNGAVILGCDVVVLVVTAVLYRDGSKVSKDSTVLVTLGEVTEKLLHGGAEDTASEDVHGVNNEVELGEVKFCGEVVTFFGIGMIAVVVDGIISAASEKGKMKSFRGGVVAMESGELSFDDGTAEVVGSSISIGNGASSEAPGGDFSFTDSGASEADGVITTGEHMVVVVVVVTVVEGVTSMGEGVTSASGRGITGVGVAVGGDVGEAIVSYDDDVL